MDVKSKETVDGMSVMIANAIGTRVTSLLQSSLGKILREQIDEALKAHGVIEPLMSIKDVARTLRVSPRTVEDLLLFNKYLKPIWVGGQRRFFVEDVRAYLQSLKCDNERKE